MLEETLRPGTGILGARVRHPNRTVRHAGKFLGDRSGYAMTKEGSVHHGPGHLPGSNRFGRRFGCTYEFTAATPGIAAASGLPTIGWIHAGVDPGEWGRRLGIVRARLEVLWHPSVSKLAPSRHD